MMKKFSILAASALIVGLTFTACSSDDESSSASIVGRWNPTTIVYSASGQTAPVEDYEYQAGCDKDYLELKEDDNYVEADHYSDCEVCSSEGSYTLNGKKIIWEGEEATVTSCS